MVIRSLIFILCLQAAHVASCQRLGFNIDLGYNIASSYQTTFENQPFQFIYAAPFGSNSLEDSKPLYDQVRLANIYGIKSNNEANFQFGGSVQFTFKNYFRIGIETSYSHFYNEIFYGFQNMLIDLSPNTQSPTFSNILDPGIVDNKIRTELWKNSYKVKLDYILPTKSVCKFHISASYMYQFIFSSQYSSHLIDKEADYTVSEKDEETGIEQDFQTNEYLNVRVFQDRIFSEFKNDQFNNLLGFGGGLQYFSHQLSIDFQFTLPNQNVYFESYQQVVLQYKFEFLSLKLFR